MGVYHVNSSVKSSLLVLLWIASHGVFVPGRLEAQLFTTLHNFDGKDGTGSAASLTLSSNCLFGTSPSGGTFGKGTVFRIHTDGSGFTNLHNFDGSDDGSAPQTGLVLSRTTLYGTAASGGKFNGGTLFAIQMDGSGFTNLYNFPTNNGGPSSLLLAGNVLFGTLPVAGSFVESTLFVVGVDGSGFTTLHTFTDGQAGKLTLSDNVLYGTTTYGGISGGGSVFSINPDGTGYTTLHSFGLDYNRGYWPLTGVIFSGDTLYGTTFSGGSNGLGTIFAVRTNGADFTVLWTFSQLWHEVTNPEIDWNLEGAQPNSLILNDNVLYGTASAGAYWGRGSIFAINPNGVVLWVPYTFSDLLPQLPSSVWPYPRTNSDGVAPLSGLVSDRNTAYGTTTGGGPFTAGTIFSLVLPPTQVAFTTQTNNNEIRITGFIGSGKSVFIPKEINGLPVTSIGTKAFAGYSFLTNVSLPNSVLSIGDAAFQRCGLLSVDIPSSVTSIGEGAFSGCSNLTNIYFEGNAPSLFGSTNVFAGNAGIIYHLPGTTGWGPTFGGRPTGLWMLPYPLILPGSIAVQSNHVEFTISWATNATVAIEASTDLRNPTWSPVQTNALSGGTFYFTDPQWNNHLSRFYRVRSQ
jgi:uncharacterized repeat protein (TIGR03803 family)